MSSFEERVRNFLKHFEELDATLGDNAGEDGYNKEFMELKAMSQAYKDNDTFPAGSGKLACNKKKNRFKDILPFEHTRVALHPEEGIEGSDYINANYITDASGDVMYIASQGPLPHTVNDFWRMVWYHNIEVVVMACREVEMGKQKCECYWGEQGEKKLFGPIEVTTVKETNVSNDFIIRDLRAECQGETQNIRQYHYTAWPDHLKPTSVYPILRMVEMLHDMRKRPAVPIVVHCSAGCGRTGTIMAIDIIRATIKNKGMSQEFSVYDIVKRMRTMRPAMVQARDQYYFVYQAAAVLAKNFLEGNTALQKPPLPAAKPGAKPPEGKEPKHDYENWTSIDSVREKVQAEAKPSPPTPAKPSVKVSEAPEPKHDYENWANIDNVREKVQAEAKPSVSVKALCSSLEEPPKPMPRKKSTRGLVVTKAEDVAPPASTKGAAPETPPKPAKSAESSPAVTRKPLAGSPPKLPKKPTESPKVAKKPIAPPKSSTPSITPKKPSIMDLLMQECGDILDVESEDKPAVDTPCSTVSEEIDAPPVPCQTEESLKLVLESSYDVPGFTYEFPKPLPEAATPPQKLSSSQLPPMEDTPPPLPTSRPPPRSTSPQPGHMPPSGAGGLGTGASTAKAKSFKNLFTPKKQDERKKKGATIDISGPAGLHHTGGAGGVPSAFIPVSPASKPSSPEPDSVEYATPILDQSRQAALNSNRSRYNFPGENGFGKRIARPGGPRKEPAHWNSGQFRRVANQS